MRLNTKSFYEFGPYRLEPEEHLLLRGEKPLPLAPKAFERQTNWSCDADLTSVAGRCPTARVASATDD